MKWAKNAIKTVFLNGGYLFLDILGQIWCFLGGRFFFACPEASTSPPPPGPVSIKVGGVGVIPIGGDPPVSGPNHPLAGMER